MIMKFDNFKDLAIHYYMISGGGGIETPSVLTDGNTEAWYDWTVSSSLTLSGSDVTQWDDISGNDRHLPGFVAQYPTKTSTGILFNGVDQLLKSAAFTVNQPFIYYLVFKPVTWTANDKLYDGSTTNRVLLWQVGASPNIAVYAGTNSAQDSNMVLGTYAVVRVYYNGASSRLQVNEETAIEGNFGANAINGLTLCRSGAAGSGYGNYEIKEIIIRSSLDGESDIYSYLTQKHGI